MKKTLALLLALVMALSLCACGTDESSSKDSDATETVESTNDTETIKEEIISKEEMIENAEPEVVMAYEINNASYENMANAKKQYCGKTLKIKGKIVGFSENGDAVIIYGGDYSVLVYLPEDDISVLKNQQQVVVIGVMSDTVENKQYVMEQAYLLEDRFEFKGVVQTAGIKIINAEGELVDGIRTIHWAEGVEVEFGQTVSFSATCIEDMGQWIFDNATVIE